MIKHQDYKTQIDPVKIVTLRRGELQLQQSQMVEILGVSSPNFISIVEAGKTKIPLKDLHLWAEALEIDPKWFIEKVIRDRYPEMANSLFGQESDKDSEAREAIHEKRRKEALAREKAKLLKMQEKLKS